MSKWAHYSTPDEEFQKCLAAAPRKSPYFQVETVSQLIKSQEAANAIFRKVVENAGPPVGITITEEKIPVTTPPGQIECRIYTPESSVDSELFPIYVHFHGGGFCYGSLDSDDLKCRDLCSKHRLVVVNVNYRHAPQFPWPSAPVDSYEATKWVVENAAKIRVNLKAAFIVGGTSAGANIACQITQRARDDADMKGVITGQVLQIPSVLTHNQDFMENWKDKFPSFEQNRDDPLLSRTSMHVFAEAYKPSSKGAPLLAESFAGLPPAFVQIAGADPLRDEGLTYEEKLREANVPTKLEIYPGVPHGFSYIFPDIAVSRKWRADLDEGLRWLVSLKQSNPEDNI